MSQIPVKKIKAARDYLDTLNVKVTHESRRHSTNIMDLYQKKKNDTLLFRCHWCECEKRVTTDLLTIHSGQLKTEGRLETLTGQIVEHEEAHLKP